ncbi:hypothetical protein AYO21_08972 [Fonsecaea monophora]|uniref:Uncharacterized protein n=1 Tax=Fonsecaea monophora TaxID=254056 RepID=A0A177F0Q8_9EURO|nr:hypothetical protein AYO21_08972 [Fonsecaea monophora]KAH0842684.1 hypothetical protein FOPE_07508 [Fonsecaea pedrosoi]OAG36799.1 hypothetical protein AYO21_08972 [Fonsecaea monophora]
MSLMQKEENQECVFTEDGRRANAVGIQEDFASVPPSRGRPSPRSRLRSTRQGSEEEEEADRAPPRQQENGAGIKSPADHPHPRSNSARINLVSPQLLTDDFSYWVSIAEGHSLPDTNGRNRESDGGVDLRPSLAPSDHAVANIRPSIQRVSEHLATPSPASPQVLVEAHQTSPQRSILASPSRTQRLEADGPGVSAIFKFERHSSNLANRAGRLLATDEGQPRFYGAASSLSLAPNGNFPLFTPLIRTVRVHGATALEQNRLAWPGDVRYESYLLEQFFRYHNPYFQEVDKGTFFMEKAKYDQGQRSHLYSPTLYNAMCA